MPDASFDDDYLASLYDLIERHGGPDETFYLELARSARSVLDVGCGTGAMLHQLRDSGHEGRLVGLDPAAGMLAQARRRDDVEWRLGYLPAAGFVAGFEFVYMTGHAFQVLPDDAAALELLAAVRRALVPGGRFAFETRNPVVRPWERWTSDDVVEVRDARGRAVRVRHDLEQVRHEDGGAAHVTFTETFAVTGRPEPLVSRSTLRFLPAAGLDQLLAVAGFDVDERYGDWDRGPFTADSPEIVTVASTRR
ncbi:Methyltransferase domain-containing protein [Jatrophihabitans endophyticus]|uniref:Methyltransferase domain-containing protein n=1 Tax=Jatrophihabitans endophyticus TaxID=1206085 RepID=A0A1M5E964_9ACTN|nr:class I SAM-dependent methyltransferase [Jatrophihabitans endophyticus]SHF75779.1 Methyltransferase domain-containing protein [Jatrophihabitans endophyticus]